MAEASAHGAVRRGSSGDRPDRTGGNRPPPPPPLRARDLISALPDAVIHHIFSFLPLQDVVKTSALSKRWQSAWTANSHLVFKGARLRSHDACSVDFPSLVDGVLIQCTSPTVKRFHVTDFKCDEAGSRKLDLWLRFAEGRRVEELRLWLFNDPRFLYKLPRFLYCLSRLVRLEVSQCCFSLGRTVRWPCLKFLSMVSVALSDDILEGIFRGSPVLESLELRECWGVKNIIIDSTSAKDLVLVGRFSNTAKIRAPHLLSLRVSGTCFYHPSFRLDNVSSLVEAELDFVIRTVLTGETTMCCNLLKEFFEKLRGVPTITIGGWCLQILSVLEMKGVPSPLSKCQNLMLQAPVSQWDLPGIAYMLRSSQCLEKLVIHLTGFPLLKFKLDEESKDCFNFDEEDFLCSRKGNFQCLAKHLKRVEITGLEANSFGSKYLLALIKFLLGDTLALENMII